MAASRSESRLPFFSLVVSTKGRSHELNNLFRSLDGQSFRDFDVIVVDQNEHDALREIIESSWDFPLRRIRCPGERGLSRGRNVGWRAASGQFICFPDDDCWYEPCFLAFAASRLTTTKADVLTGRAADVDGRDINGRFAGMQMQVTERGQVWNTQIEWVAFFSHSLLERLHGYDEEVGIGADSPWQACEGQEIVLRALEMGAKCFYDPGLVGRHAEIVVSRPNKATLRKAQGYARGMGYVLRKHQFGLISFTYWIARALVRAAIMLVILRPLEARYYAVVALGRLQGVLKCPSGDTQPRNS